MKCPLMLKEWKPSPEFKQWEPLDCFNEECGFWDENGGRCSVVQISRLLHAIGMTLGRISIDDNMARYTFRCRDCGLTIMLGPGDPGDMPTGWTRNEQVDGKMIMLCEACSSRGKIPEEKIPG